MSFYNKQHVGVMTDVKYTKQILLAKYCTANQNFSNRKRSSEDNISLLLLFNPSGIMVRCNYFPLHQGVASTPHTSN